MTAIIWSKMAPRIDLASLAEAYRSFFFAWSRADGTRTPPAVARADAAGEPAADRAAGGDEATPAPAEPAASEQSKPRRRRKKDQ